MNPLRRWRRRAEVDGELISEMEAHIEERAAELMAAGQSAGEARRNARLQFGNVALQLEKSRDAWGWNGMEEFFGDLRFGCRLLSKSPGFTLTTLLTLALAIGATTAVFTVVDSVLLRPLNFPDSGELVMAWEHVPFLGNQPGGPNPRHADLWKKRATAFAGMALLRQSTAGIAANSESPRVAGYVTGEANLFDILGVSPARGRAFTAEDGIPGRNHVVVLTDALWHSWLNGDPKVIGRRVRVSDVDCEIIGVLPEGFRFPNANSLRAFHSTQGLTAVPEPGIFQPASIDPAKNGWSMDYGNWMVLGRIRKGITRAQAEAQLSSIQVEVARQVRMAGGGPEAAPRVSLQPMQEAVVGGSRRRLWFLLAAVGALLLTACLNLASAQLGRAISRHREAAVRSALGASRWRLLRAALAENIVLAAGGGAAGVLLAWLGLELFRRQSALEIPRLAEVSLNWRVLVFSVGITVASSLIFGLWPALRLMRADPQSALQRQTNRAMGSRQSSRANMWLVALEVAGCAALLVTTAVFGKSLMNLLTQDKGFATEQVAVAQVDLSSVLYAKAEDRVERDGGMLNAVRAIPGVEWAGITSKMPLEGESWIEELRRADIPAQETPLLNMRWISAGYFEALRQQLAAGRFLSDGDRDLHSVVLSQGFVKAVWGQQNPLGAAVELEGRTFTVVGVVADTRSTSLKASPVHTAFVHYNDRPPFSTFLVARGRQPARALLAEMRDAIGKAAPAATLNRVKTLDEQMNDSIALERFQTAVLVSFGGAALGLAMLGIYGVLSCAVAGRKQEIGVRVALGATRSAIYRQTLGDACLPLFAGLAAGLGGGVLVARLTRTLLYGIEGVQPSMILAVMALFLTAALAAAFIPARRAASVDPMEALRNE